MSLVGFTRWLNGNESICQAEDMGLIPGLEDPLEEEMATHSSVLAWRIPMDRGAWRAVVHGLQRVGHDLAAEHQQSHL